MPPLSTTVMNNRSQPQPATNLALPVHEAWHKIFLERNRGCLSRIREWRYHDVGETCAVALRADLLHVIQSGDGGTERMLAMRAISAAQVVLRAVDFSMEGCIVDVARRHANSRKRT